MANRISQSSARTLATLEPFLTEGSPFRFALPLDEIDQTIAERVGLPITPKDGFSFLPGVSGKVSDHNANGTIVVRKDQKMEHVSRMIMRSWKDWHGNTHYGTQSRSYPRYPRDFSPPPEELFYLIRIDDTLCVTSKILTLTETSEESILRVFNLFLESFGQCFIAGGDGKSITRPRFKRLNWDLLPQGDYPWQKLETLLRERIKVSCDEDVEVVLHRIQRLRSLNPSNYGIGRGGFRGYIAIQYPKTGYWVLESSAFDNATYVFDQDWLTLTNLTKKEVLEGAVCKQRIIHDKTWFSKVKRALDLHEPRFWRD